ncbi:hypothetical protein H6F67_04330 [Microcoleus sp. FACHB-1515]|uniref:hypothetical protein n=1 Tax=Cyanophyceae TaxID=3028117 RepID=UPI00168255FF|nr:hypothetical protein [Microcoleus sp. FACHB-1515]MBD2089080.1 hypothetical protein [Microcoleus sp. FACHB-1515]
MEAKQRCGFTVWGAVVAIAFTSVLSVAVAPGSAQGIAAASANRLTLTLEREAEESYAVLERRAEAAARAATQRLFDSDLLVRSVVVTIVAENRGLAAPVLTLQVTREQWRQLPDPQRWSTYYPSASALLQLSPTAPATSAPDAASVQNDSLPTVQVEQAPAITGF